MSPEDAARARKMVQMGVNVIGGGPGGCKSEEECRVYCEDPAHTEECIIFSIEQGFISPEEGQRMLEMLRMPLPQMGPPPGMPPEEIPEGFMPSEGMPEIPEGMMRPPHS